MILRWVFISIKWQPSVGVRQLICAFSLMHGKWKSNCHFDVFLETNFRMHSNGQSTTKEQMRWLCAFACHLDWRAHHMRWRIMATKTCSHHMGDITHVYKSNYLLTVISTSFNHFNWGSYMEIYHKRDDIFVLHLYVMTQRHAIIIIIIICCWWWLKCHLPFVHKLLSSDLHWQSVEGVFALVFLYYFFSAYDFTQSSQTARWLNRQMRVADVSPIRCYWSLDVKFQAFAVSLEIISN